MASFEWYRTFVAVYRMESMSAAAQERFLSQPAVSQQIQALEADLGVHLFVRTSKRTVPTDAGKELYVAVAQAVDRLERAGSNDGSHSGPALRLGFPAEYFYHQCTRALGEIRARIRVQFGLTEELVPQLRSGELDLVVAAQRLGDEGIQYVPLYEEHFCLCISMKWTVPQITELCSLQQWLLTVPWIAYSTELPIIRRYWQVVFGERPDLRPKIIVPDLRAILRLIEEGVGVSVLPTYLFAAAEGSKTVQVLSIPHQPVTNQLWIAYRRVESSDEVIQTIVRLLQQTRPST